MEGQSCPSATGMGRSKDRPAPGTGGAGGGKGAQKASYRDVEGGDHVEGGGKDGAHGFH